MSDLIYENEDFAYCIGCIHAMTGVCDTCDEGTNFKDEDEDEKETEI